MKGPAHGEAKAPLTGAGDPARVLRRAGSLVRGGMPAALLIVSLTAVYLTARPSWDTVLSSEDYLFADVNDGILGTERLHFGRPLHRHVPFTLLVHPLSVVGAGIGLHPLAFPTALWGAVGAVLVMGIFWEWGRLEAILGGACFGLCSAVVLYAGVPETYVPTGTLVLVSCLLWGRAVLAPRRRHLVPYLGSLVALGVLNPVVVALLVVALSGAALATPCRRWDVAASGIVLLPFVYAAQSFLVHLAMPGMSWGEAAKSGRNYLLHQASLNRLVASGEWATVLANLLVASLGAPPLPSFHDHEAILVLGQWREVLGGVVRSFSLAPILVVVAAGAVARRLGGRARRWGAVAFVYGVLLATFLVWFNPRETFLYTPAWVGPYLLACLEPLGAVPRRIRRVFLALSAITLAVANLFVVASF